MQLNWPKFLTVFGLVALIVGIIHLLGVYFSLFWLLPWIDIPAHILGGFLSALFTFTIWYFFKKDSKDNNFFVAIIIGTLIIGVLWELYEYYAGLIYVKDRGYIFDTIYDFFNDTLGAILAFYYLKYFFFANDKKDNPTNQSQVIQ